MKHSKIFFLFPSVSGHINSVFGLVNELCKNADIECVFYGNEENREIIEHIGAQFRLFSHRNFALIEPFLVTEQKPILHLFFSLMYECSFALLPELIRDVEAERPSMIIYDTAFFPARCLLKILKNKEIETKSVMFVSNFVFDSELMSSMPGMKKNIFMY